MSTYAFRIALVVSIVVGLTPAAASAQSTFEVLHRLVEPEYPPVGKLLEVASGRLYGVVQGSPSYSKGALLAYDRLPNGTLGSTVIHAFTGPDGALPSAGVIHGSDGALYGTTFAGGADDLGTVYRIAPDGAFTLLFSFTQTTGGQPSAELVEASDGHLYGTTTYLHGAVFRITKSGLYSTVYDPTNLPEPPAYLVEPRHALIDGGDGRLYGVARVGSAYGVIYSITLGGVFTVLHAFNRPGPVYPLSLTDGGDGFFYGTTSNAFTDSPGTVFRISRSGALTVLFSDSGPDPVDYDRDNLMRGADGNFYGTTFYGGNGHGTVFRMTPAGQMTRFHPFHYSFGSTPNSLVLARNGTLLGSTFLGGFSRRGVIFQLTTGGQYSVIHTFPGSGPLSIETLINGPDGAIYGSSCGGGPLNAGTLFKLTENARVLTVLHSFAYWDGSCPMGPMVFGADGALYGTAGRYGLGGGGTIFRMTSGGVFSVLRYFTGPDGAWPHGLIRASDGNLYGTTAFGGAIGSGTVYRLSSAGFSTLHSLQRTTFAIVNAELVQAADGHLYGVAPWRPFRLTLGGDLTYLNPVPGLVWPLVNGADGNLYGTTTSDQNPDRPRDTTLFRMTMAGATTVLHTFARTTESPEPCFGLITGPDGTLYGRGCSDHTGNFPGSIFALSGTGPPVTLHAFDPAVGSAPTPALMFGPDGALYGATGYGSPTFRGVIYRLRLP